MKARCKFVCAKIEDNAHSESSKVVTFEARYCPEVAEDIAYTKYTPWGSMRVCIDNPSVTAMLEVNKPFYIDISQAE